MDNFFIYKKNIIAYLPFVVVYEDTNNFIDLS